ncbi:MAG: RNA polymerase sigma factor [Clostridiales Family XIII bacterium]|nr:RNA polymerase sigma factor [Clostridiales Family XIII bacterium]
MSAKLAKIPQITDKEEFYAIVERAKGGDEAAFKALVENKARSILFQTNSMLKNPHDAEDAAQEVVLILYKNISRLRNPRVFNAWANRIIINTCKAMLGKKDRRKEDFVVEEFYDIISDKDIDFIPSASLEDEEARDRIVRLIDSLPGRRRDAIRMYFFQEMSYAEIAVEMDVSVQAVSSYIAKGRNQIRKSLGDIR